MKRKLLSVILVLSMLCAFMPVIASAATSGSCGANLTWTLDDEGTLTISGEGDMRDYSSYEAPWYTINPRIKKVVIEQGVTSIGFDAFYYCGSLTSVTIPDSVTSIGNYAFYYCSALTNVSIPNSVKSIGSWAFDYCSALTSVSIGSEVTSIGSFAFSGCSGLTSVTIPNSVKSIGSWAFDNCDNLDSVYISDLAAYLNINFGNAIANPMRYANKLYINGKRVAGTVKIPAGVTRIPPYAFSGCDGIKSVEIPDSVKNIGGWAFYGCNGLTSIEMPKGITIIGSFAFSGCSGLTSIEIPDSITNIETSVFYGCDGLKDVYITDLAKWCEIDFGNYNSNPLYCADNLYVNGVLITNLVIPNGVASIGSNAFAGCSGLTSVTIPNSVTSIGEYVFYGCSGLTSITIPDNVTSVGSYTFDKCPELTTVNYNAPKIVSNLFGKGYSSYDNNVLLIVLGDNVKSVDVNAFERCANLKRIIIPKSVTEIERAAFKDCTSLTTVEYGGSETDWNEMYIGTENENLEKANFVFNSSLSNTTLTDLDYLTYTVNEDNMVTITNCYENATKINIPKEIDGKPVTAINASAFANRSKLTSVTIPESVTSIGERAFYGCSSLTDIAIPSGVTTIESNTFYDCGKLKNITIPKSVTAIKSYAFYGCGSLTDTYYSGTDADFGNIKIDYGNDTLTKSNIHYNSTAPTPTPTPTPRPTPVPITTAEITKEETDTAYTFTVTPETAYENCFVYAAIYDADGVLLGVNCVPLQMTGSTSVSVDKQENGVTAKVFIWSDFMQSIIKQAEEFPLT